MLLYDKLVSSNKKTKYETKIRFIMYVIIKTWVDIIFTISMISCFVKKLELDHLIDFEIFSQ